MNLLRRNFLKLAGSAIAASALPRLAFALDYPTRPTRIIAGFAAGGGVDITARLIGQWLADHLGQPFVVENRTGAGGNIGTEAVVNSAPDGYTLLLATVPNAVNASLYDNLKFNFVRDIAPVAGVIGCRGRAGPAGGSGADDSGIHCLRQSQSGQGQHGLGRQRQRAAHGGRTVQDDDRRRHGSCALSRPGPGDDGSARRPGADPVCGCAGNRRLCQDRQAARAGGDHRRADAGTAGGSGRRRFRGGYEASQWYGFAAPKNTPAEIVDKLNKEINVAMADPGMKARLAAIGGETMPGSPADFGRLISDETEKWGKVVRTAGIKPE